MFGRVGHEGGPLLVTSLGGWTSEESARRPAPFELRTRSELKTSERELVERLAVRERGVTGLWHSSPRGRRDRSMAESLRP